jgi:hypothetical protein
MQVAWCLDCHGTDGFDLRDPITGEPRDLFVDRDVYARSSHASLDCRRCHERGYRRVPHTHSGYYPRFMCVDCHEKDAVGSTLQLRERKLALLASAHGRVLGTPLDCHDCHDPHEFRPIRDHATAHARTRASNALCLRCHGPLDVRLLPQLGSEVLVDALTTHRTFPNPRAHFRKVKCVTCHVPARSETLHDVVPAAQAIAECTACHTRDSALLAANYTQPGADRAADPVERNAYVVGSTRSRLLDRSSQIGFLLMCLIVVTHGTARVLRRREGRR